MQQMKLLVKRISRVAASWTVPCPTHLVCMLVVSSEAQVSLPDCHEAEVSLLEIVALLFPFAGCYLEHFLD